MKKTIVIRLLAWLAAILLTFSACRKVDTPATGPGDANPPASLVPKEMAREAARAFKESDYGSNGRQAPRKLLNGNNTITSELVYTDKEGRPALYVFNFSNNLGYVFVSADYNLRPILAFVDNGEFKNENLPEGLQMWIGRTIENVDVVRAGLYDNSKAGATAWNRYIKENKVDITGISNKPPPDDPPCDPNAPPLVVTRGPLLPVTWGQGCSYNELCNITVNYNCYWCNTRPATGCVATAMAQVIRYHQFPGGTYNYASMPTGSGNGEVQRLMRDAGVSVNMSYGCSSSAYGSAIVPALKNTFGYGSANRWGYSTVSGYSRLKSNISSGWPVLLEGQDASAGGHEWVCDGWRETTYYMCLEGAYAITYLHFHMNWGWHETGGGTDYNGWFAFDNWNIWGLNWNFQYSRYAITEIRP